MILGGKESGQSVTEKVAEYIIGHVSNSSLENPIIKIDPIFGIDLSVTCLLYTSPSPRDY